MTRVTQSHVVRARDGLADLSYADVGCEKLRRACGALGWDQASQGRVVHQFKRLLEPGGSQPIGKAPFLSFLANDQMPIELSVAWTPYGNEVRAYFESLGAPPTAESCQAAGLALTRRLATEPGVSLEHFMRVADLFLARIPSWPFSIWNGVMWRRGERPWFKVFLNPQIHGRQQSAAVVEEAMRRLGLRQSWASFLDHLGVSDFTGPARELGIFSLDLRDPADARVRIYLRHAGATADDLEHAAACARNQRPGKVRQICRDMTGLAGPYRGKPPVTAVSFRVGEPKPASVTLYIPLDPNFENDDASRARVSAVLWEEGIDPAGYLATLRALADRPLAQSRVQSWLGYLAGIEPRVAVYFATGAYEAVAG
jgi:DMATS type aromatic prenyltransferase